MLARLLGRQTDPGHGEPRAATVPLVEFGGQTFGINTSSYAFDGANQKMIATFLGHAYTGSTERCTHLWVVETQPLVEARWARLLKPKG